MPAVETPSPAEPPVVQPASPAPVALAGGGWALPASVLTAMQQQFRPRPNDLICASCEGALFIPHRVVRMRAGYPEGAKTSVTLFACLRCGALLNPQELVDIR